MIDSTSHTPGPWGKDKGTVLVRGLTWVAHAHWNAPQAEANARLIEAAPEMLIALEQVKFGLEVLLNREPSHNGIQQDLAVVNAAIAKATVSPTQGEDRG